MKKLLTLAVFVSSVCSFAATCNWHAANLDAKFNNGTAYLVEVTKSGVTADTIKTALGTTGIAATTPDGYKLADRVLNVGAVTNGEEKIYLGNYAGYDFVDMPSYTTVDPNAASANVFVIVLTEDKKSFTMSDITTITGDSNEFTVGTLADWSDVDNSAWTTSGPVAPVPEPTVLALLALGVAGMALKRKVA